MITFMNDDMTIWTNWTQIVDRINVIFFADFRKGYQVMHMNDISTNFTIRFFKIKPANDTSGSIMTYALISCFSITLITIHIYLRFVRVSLSQKS